jgi:hypothetical protein
MIGIICDLTFKYHWLQENYYLSLKNIFDEIKIINNENDLDSIEKLFICDEHFTTNKKIWMSDKFIEKCNVLKIQVIIFNNEKIFNSFFPWNEDIQKNVDKFKYKIQFVYDINDALIIGTEVNKTYMSKEYKKIFDVLKNGDKKNKLIFIGNYSNATYVNRIQLLNDIKNKFDVDILPSDSNRTMKEYFDLINKYKYVLSPIGNGDFIPMRFYETLLVGSIPVQQFLNNKLLNFFDEEKKIAIFFNDVNKLSLNDNLRKIDYYMEDYMTNVLQKYNII